VDASIKLRRYYRCWLVNIFWLVMSEYMDIFVLWSFGLCHCDLMRTNVIEEHNFSILTVDVKKEAVCSS
jgi:RIO-like serine/threonine protein kinase